MIIIFLSILLFSSCFSHHNLFYTVWQESYTNLFFALLCLQLAVFSIQKIRFSSSSLFVDAKAGLPIDIKLRNTSAWMQQLALLPPNVGSLLLGLTIGTRVTIRGIWWSFWIIIRMRARTHSSGSVQSKCFCRLIYLPFLFLQYAWPIEYFRCTSIW